MSGQEVEVYQNQSMSVMSADGVLHQVQHIQQVMQVAMKEGEHYGVIPGTKEKTLYKSGAEKLLLTFRLAPKYEEVSAVEVDDLINYRVRCNIHHIPTGAFVGSGLGACNSREKKYRTRSVAVSKATNEEKAAALRTETRAGSYGEYQVLIIPQDPWDVQNTVYKMACKRALIAAVLNALAASDIFMPSDDDDEKPKGQAAPTSATATTPPDKISDAQRKRLYAIWKSSGFSDAEARDYLSANYGIENSSDIKKTDYENIVKHFSEPQGNQE